MNLGDTFIWSPNGGRDHLYIAVTDPKRNSGNFVAFNLTKSRGGPKALTFRVGDHPYIIKYDSDINFGDGLIVNLSKIQGEITVRRAIPHQPMSLEQVKCIADFSKDHPAVSGDIIRLINAQFP